MPRDGLTHLLLSPHTGPSPFTKTNLRPSPDLLPYGRYRELCLYRWSLDMLGDDEDGSMPSSSYMLAPCMFCSFTSFTSYGCKFLTFWATKKASRIAENEGMGESSRRESRVSAKDKANKIGSGYKRKLKDASRFLTCLLSPDQTVYNLSSSSCAEHLLRYSSRRPTSNN